MPTFIRAVNKSSGSVYVFSSQSWVNGVNSCNATLAAGSHPNAELQADYDDGDRFDYFNLGGYPEGSSVMSLFDTTYSLSSSPYHASEAQGRVTIGDLRKKIKLLESKLTSSDGPDGPYLAQVSSDGEEVVYKWPDVASAAKVHGVKVEKLEDAIESGDVKYGFLWRMLGE